MGPCIAGAGDIRVLPVVPSPSCALKLLPHPKTVDENVGAGVSVGAGEAVGVGDGAGVDGFVNENGVLNGNGVPPPPLATVGAAVGVGPTVPLGAGGDEGAV